MKGHRYYLNKPEALTMYDLLLASGFKGSRRLHKYLNLVYALAEASENLGIYMCADTLFLNGFPHYKFVLFPLAEAFLAIFAIDLPLIPIRHN